MKYLIVGLGNPGLDYEFTRHNIGFSVLDSLAKDYNATFSLERHAYTSELKINGRLLKLIKPTTFMNLTGKAVNYWLQKENLTDLSSLLVVCDDISLDFGMSRLKSKGGAGGHNGLSDIITVLNNSNFNRLRIGIGNSFPRGMQSEYVLGKWDKSELQELPFVLSNAKDIIKSFVVTGIDLTMTQFNKKK